MADPFKLARQRIEQGYPISAAFGLAQHFHAGQVDLQGEPYIRHLIVVAQDVDDEFGDSLLTQIAYLHDIVEDTPVTLDQLTEVGFHPIVVDAVDAVTQRQGELYAEFIRRAGRHPQGSRVMLRALSHNLDPSRGPIPEPLRERYRESIGVVGRAIHYNTNHGPEEI